jgi:hypothetical protein
MLVAGGDVSDYTPSAQLELQERFARSAGVSPDAVTVEIVAASVRIKVTIMAADTQEANAATATLTRLLATPTSASNFLGGIQLASGAALQVSSVENAIRILAPPSSPPAQPPAPPAPNLTMTIVEGETAAMALSDGSDAVGASNAPEWTYLVIGGLSVLAAIFFLVVLVLSCWVVRKRFGHLAVVKRRARSSLPAAIGAQQGIALESATSVEGGYGGAVAPTTRISKNDADYFAAVMETSASSSSLPAYQIHHFTDDEQSTSVSMPPLHIDKSASLASLHEDHPFDDLGWRTVRTPRPSTLGETSSCMASSSAAALGSYRDDDKPPGAPKREESGTSSVGESLHESSRSESSVYDGELQEQLYRSMSSRRSERV